MRISAIAALSEQNRALGKQNQLLWRIPGDLKRVRELTMGHPIIMGRRTMESLVSMVGTALPGRTNIVLSHKLDKPQKGFDIVHSVEEALALAQNSPAGNSEIFIFGGARTYELFLKKHLINRLYLTVVRDEPEADSFFPDYSEFKNVVQKSEVMQSDGLSYYYLTLER